MNPTSHALYRFYDRDDHLLYIGITANPGRRWTEHAQDKPWWHDVATVLLERHPTREAVLAAERAAITAEQPRHNSVHNHGHADPIQDLDDYLVNVIGAHPDTGTFGTHPSHMPDVCTRCDNDTIHHPTRWTNGTATYRCHRGHTWTCSWGHTHTGQAA